MEFGDPGVVRGVKIGENALIHALELSRITPVTGNLMLDSVGDAIQKELLARFLPNLPGAVM